MAAVSKVLVLLLSFPAFCSAATCPCGATYNSQFNKCYDFFSARKSFFEAQQMCQDMDGQLVSIRNGFENSLIAQGAIDSFSTDDFWAGGTDVDNPGTWTWTDGSSLNYSNWASGYPDGQDGHDCLSVQLNTGKWQCVGCFVTKPFVCEIPLTGSQPQASSATCPSPPPSQLVCPSTWTYFAEADSCYKVFFAADWGNSEATCLSFQANLASIHSEGENDFVISITASGYTITDGFTWIGLHSVLPDQWTWSDGTPLNYTKWSPGHPLSGPHCAELVADHYSPNEAVTHTWFSRDCSYVLRNFVCKKAANH